MIRLDDPEDPVDTERADAGHAPDDTLLAALDQTDATGPDIAAKIRADQGELISTPPDTLLLIEGGPGTGKTMTALRRVAWLIDVGGLPADEVLVVGPSAAFARYTHAILESWGFGEVEHHPVDGLLPAVATGRDEALYVTRLKGEERLAGLLGRALDDYLGRLPADLPQALTVEGRAVPLDRVALAHVMTTARASKASDGDRRRILRGVLVAGSKDPRAALAAADPLADLLWPEFDPAEFLRELFGSREWLTAAAGGEFTEREISALYRTPADSVAGEVWSDADLPLLDEADHLVNGTPDGYAHVVLDEAQDLSPMQVRAVARRSATGSMTIVGDMAQSTGPWARDDWHDVLAQMPDGPPHIHRELRFGYRVPRQIFDLAAELLPTAAPSVQAPTTVRDGPAEPMIMPVEPADRAGAVVTAAAEHAADGGTVVILCPAPCRAEIEARLNEEDVPWRPATESGAGIALLSPHEAKGLEFDVAVVVEPGFIVDDDPRGHRLLYIALTRATGRLYLIGAPEDLPIDFGDSARPVSAVAADSTPGSPDAGARPAPDRGPSSQAQSSAQSQAPAQSQDSAQPQSSARPAPRPEPAARQLDPAVRETIDVVAHRLAETLLANLTPELWPIALERVVDLITPDHYHHPDDDSADRPGHDQDESPD